MAEQVAIRIRQHNCKTGCVHLHIGTSILETRPEFSHQMKIPVTDNTKELQNYCLFLFDKYCEGQEVRHVGITYSKLVYTNSLQLDLFSDPQNMNYQKYKELGILFKETFNRLFLIRTIYLIFSIRFRCFINTIFMSKYLFTARNRMLLISLILIRGKIRTIC